MWYDGKNGKEEGNIPKHREKGSQDLEMFLLHWNNSYLVPSEWFVCSVLGPQRDLIRWQN